jgi:phosphonatase-like hydrolase
VFASLRRAGIRVALDTGFSRDILNVVLDRVGWREGETFDISIASDEVDRGRPHPDLIHHAMARAGVVAPGAVVKVGDTPADLLQGHAAKCGLVVGVTHGTHTRAELRSPDVQVIDTLPALLPLLGVED